MRRLKKWYSSYIEGLNLSHSKSVWLRPLQLIRQLTFVVSVTVMNIGVEWTTQLYIVLALIECSFTMIVQPYEKRNWLMVVNNCIVLVCGYQVLAIERVKEDFIMWN